MTKKFTVNRLLTKWTAGPLHSLAALLVIVALLSFARPAFAKLMLSYDLDSLAYMSTQILEVSVVAATEKNWINIVTCKVHKAYAGTIKANEAITIGLSAYAKGSRPDFTAGDHLIIFVEPARQEWKAEDIPYWPVPSGVKVIENDLVTGMIQEANPGPYVNAISEGNIDQYRVKIVEAVRWSDSFKKSLSEHKSDTEWLLARLKERPPVKSSYSDRISMVLHEAITATGNAEAIARAKQICQDH